MSEQQASPIFDIASWRRAMSPTVRTIGYSMSIYLILNLVILLPLNLFNVSEEVYSFFGAIITVLFFVAILISFFKVLDEEQVKNTNMIKLL